MITGAVLIGILVVLVVYWIRFVSIQRQGEWVHVWFWPSKKRRAHNDHIDNQWAKAKWRSLGPQPERVYKTDFRNHGRNAGWFLDNIPEHLAGKGLTRASKAAMLLESGRKADSHGNKEVRR